MSAVVHTLLDHGTDIQAAMNAVFRAGGDTDSIGATVAACIGAQIGVLALPEKWAGTVQHRDSLVWLADRLAVQEAVSATRAEIIEVEGDIAAREVDAIVNAWNRNLIPPWLVIPQGVARAIRSAGGRAVIAAAGRAGPLPLGNAMETNAGQLAAKWVIHADAIDLAWRASEQSIRQAAQSSLRLAHWLGARTVALPLLGAGSGGFGCTQAFCDYSRGSR